MQNKLTDLNNHLFCQLERLSDEKLNGDLLREECMRSRSIEGTAKCIIENSRLALDVCRTIDEGMNANLVKTLPKMLSVSEPEPEETKPGKFK